MPSYAPPKPRPKRVYHSGPRPLNFDWIIRTTNALALLDGIRTDDPHALDHIARARAHLALLRNVETNKTYAAAHRAAARELAIAFYLIEPKQNQEQ